MMIKCRCGRAALESSAGRVVINNTIHTGFDHHSPYKACGPVAHMELEELTTLVADMREGLEKLTTYTCETCDGTLCPPGKPGTGNGPCAVIEDTHTLIIRAKEAIND